MKPRVTAVVLCGGSGRRMATANKPLLRLGEHALVEHVIERLRPQVDSFVLSCGQREDEYMRFGHPVVLDEQPGEGPLGGIVSALGATTGAWVLTTPADTPFLPRNLVKALTPACRRRGAGVAMAGRRRQNLTMLLDQAQAESLRGFFAQDGRAVHRWLATNAVPAVEFPADDFLNVNTPADLEAARLRLAAPDAP